MNHQPFRSWLLSEEPLPPEQAQALQEHLQSCEACRQIDHAWNDVHALFQHLPDAVPAPGFTERWQQRMVENQLHKQQQQAWAATAFTAFIAFMLILAFGAQIVEMLRSPTQLALLWIARLSGLLHLFEQAQAFLVVLCKAAPVVPLTGMIFSTGIICFLCVSWLATYRQLTISRRIAL
ncbi:MAG: zf-HC2 domain-containing protein [Anaerolineales bacterium]|nr:zf-HC2 domain-containing protein [Anaerolineales bacterium]